MKVGDKVQDIEIPLSIGRIVQVSKDSVTVRAGFLIRYTFEEAKQYLTVVESEEIQLKMSL